MTKRRTVIAASCAFVLAAGSAGAIAATSKDEGKKREDFVVTIDKSDDTTAFAKVRCQVPPRYFTDYLVALKLNDGWRIVSKTYRYDVKE